jgi:8-oxo-dGTP pyrophosphatase MutT (NUDIX family)
VTGSGGGEPSPRRAARVIVRDADGRLLMFRGIDPADPGRPYWFTPGGGLDEDETFEEAAAREVSEEAGVEVVALGEVVFEDEVVFPFDGVTYRQRQRYYAVQLDRPGSGVSADRGRWTEDELRSVSEDRWWSLEELETTTEAIYPPDLPRLVRSVPRWGAATAKGDGGPR